MKKVFIVCACVAFSIASIAQTLNPQPREVSKMKKVDYLDLNSNYSPTAAKGVVDGSRMVIGSSSNLYSVLLAEQSCVSVDPLTKSIAMFHRSNSETTYGNDLVMSFSKDNGWSWNDIVVYSDASYPVRYPQGALCNAMSSTDPDDVYAFATAPILVSGTWGGCLFSTVKLDSSNSNNQFTLFANADDDVEGVDVDFSRTHAQARGSKVFAMSEASEDDGTYYTLHRSIINVGTFDAEGILSWERYLHYPDYALDPENHVSGYVRPALAMEDENTGYLVYCGIDATDTIDSITYKPIVYKTEDAWQTSTKVDFDWTAIPAIKEYADSNSNVQRPFFLSIKDAVVDGEGNLHVISFVNPAFSDHQDSLGYMGVYTYIQGFIYDSYLTADGWNAFCVDTIWAKEVTNNNANTPIINSSDPESNPEWDERMQMSISPDGMKVFFTWMDTDLSLPIDSSNTYPDIYVRMFDVASKTLMDHVNLTVGTLYDGDNYWMYAGDYATDAGDGNYNLHIVTSSFNDDDAMPVDHLYFKGLTIQGSDGQLLSSGVRESIIDEFVSMYPNPTSNSINFSFGQNEDGEYNVEVLNTLGSVVMSQNINVNNGSVQSVNIENLPNGIYVVKISNNSKSISKKLIKN